MASFFRLEVAFLLRHILHLHPTLVTTHLFTGGQSTIVGRADLPGDFATSCVWMHLFDSPFFQGTLLNRPFLALFVHLDNKRNIGYRHYALVLLEGVVLLQHCNVKLQDLIGPYVMKCFMSPNRAACNIVKQYFFHVFYDYVQQRFCFAAR